MKLQLKAILTVNSLLFSEKYLALLDLNIIPLKRPAIATRRHVTKGRADTLVGALVIEFKQPSTLANAELQAKAIAQVSEYLEGLELNLS